MSQDAENPLEHPEVKLANAGSYIFAFFAAFLLMGISLILVKSRPWSPEILLGAISLSALIAVVLQFYFLFHLDLSRTQVWNTTALVLIVPLFIIAIGLTLWMFHTLHARTMITGMGGMP